MRQTIRINKHDIARMVCEAIQEISLGTVKKAQYPDISVEKAIADIEEELERYGAGYGNPEANALYTAAKKGLEAVKAYFGRKEAQAGNMHDVAYSASTMRDGDSDDGQITSAEYADADRRRNERDMRSSINNAIKDGVRKRGYISCPDRLLPIVSDYRSGDGTVSVEMYNNAGQDSRFAKFLETAHGVIDDVMHRFGYAPQGPASTIGDKLSWKYRHAENK